MFWQYFDLDEFGNKLGTGGVAVANAEPVLDIEGQPMMVGHAGGMGVGVGGGPMLNQPWVMPDGMGAKKDDGGNGGEEINPYNSMAGQGQ